MGKLYATDNFKTGNWSLDTSEIGPTSNDLFITFTEEAPVITFKDLKFGYELRQDGNIKQYGVYPPAGVRYKRSDQEYLVSARLKLETEESYSLFLWAENDGQRFEKEFNFVTPRPRQPYDSWTWNSTDKRWDPPVPYPDDGNDYTWDEETTSWVVAETDETQS
jgi:hypothetical protein